MSFLQSNVIVWYKIIEHIYVNIYESMQVWTEIIDNRI